MLSRILSQSLNVWASAIQAASEHHKLKRYRGEGGGGRPIDSSFKSPNITTFYETQLLLPYIGGCSSVCEPVMSSSFLRCIYE